MFRPARTEYTYSEFKYGRIERELPLDEALQSVSLRMKHFVDECPKRDVIFEVDSDVSESALVKVIEKLSAKFAHIDVITHDDELRQLVVARLKTDLELGTMKRWSGATDLAGTWRDDDSYTRKPQKSNDFSLTVGTLSHFVKAEFERDVKEARKEERKEDRVVVLYRTESMLDGRGILEPLPVETVELHIATLLCHIYSAVGVMEEREVPTRWREYIKRYSGRFVYRFLEERIEDLISSARLARTLVEGTHFGFVQIDDKNCLIVTSTVERHHLGIRQFLQIHHSLPLTPLRVPTLELSPLHLLKAYGRVMGVFRRGMYELREWLPLITQLNIYPSRVYPHDAPVTPLFSMPPSVSISEWIVQVEKLSGIIRKVPQRGARLIVCPSKAAMIDLCRYFKYSHDIIVSLTTRVICMGTAEQLERALLGRPGRQLVMVFTTAAHFETWHTRYLRDMEVVTVFLGTPTRDVQYLRRAYRFARPVMNVITVPFEPSISLSLSDSGFESDSSGGSGEQQTLCAQALSQVANRSHWADIFMNEMCGRGDWKAPLSCPEDAKYENCVEWMRKKWKEESSEEVKIDFEEWRAKMMEKYREEMRD